ncbi:hypothetical protein [Bartonella sp. CB169]|uniref:hypothetical protein n=1 Tax=Bartonella sp. CB169 TaxID=3112257 RepID=UPI00300E1CA2
MDNYIDQSITENDIKLISSDFVRYLRDPLPSATTILIVKANETDDKFTSLLINIFQQNGYEVLYIDTPEKSQNPSVNLTYKVMLMDHGIVLVAKYGVTEVTRYYIRLTTGNFFKCNDNKSQFSENSHVPGEKIPLQTPINQKLNYYSRFRFYRFKIALLKSFS